MMWEAAARQDPRCGGQHATGPRGRRLLLRRRPQASGRSTVARADGDVRDLHGAPRRSPRRRSATSSRGITPAPIALLHARALRLPRFPHRRADRARAANCCPTTGSTSTIPRVKVGRVQNFRSWSPEMVPDAARPASGLEYFCFEGDGLWKPRRGAGRARQGGDRADRPGARRRRRRRLRRAPAEGLSGLRRDYREQRRRRARAISRALSRPASRRPQRHAQIQQPGSRDDDGDAHGANILAGETIYDVWQVNEDAEYGEQGLSGAQEALLSVRMGPSRVSSRAA